MQLCSCNQLSNQESNTRHLSYRAYGKAGNGNETETGNGNWKWKLEMETGNKWEQKTHQSLVQCFLHSVLSTYSSILLSNQYGTGFMSHALPLLLYCAL